METIWTFMNFPPGLLTDAANDNDTTVRSFEADFIYPFARAPPASVTELSNLYFRQKILLGKHMSRV
jgi:hypothetical protein